MLCVSCLAIRLLRLKRECLCGSGCNRDVLLCIFQVLSVASGGCVVRLGRVERAAFIEGKGSL